MAKYRSYEKQTPARSKDPHPVWRGIGCLIMLLVPALSLGISAILVQMAPSLGFQLPDGLIGRPVMPELLFQVPGLVGILNWIQSLDNLYAILVGTFTITILLAGVLALGYAFIYRIVGPPRYSGIDAPPPNIKVRKYKR
jgi:predicted acyltransferase